ncbi:MAG: ATP-binding protein [Alcanivorax sp.]|nr:ATP-binding protein [Alcanivorax sp.]
MEHPLQPPVDYQDLFDNAPLGYLLLDASGSIERINQTGAALFAQDAEGMTGRPFAEWVADADRERFDRYRRRLRESDEMEKLFVRVRTRHGEDLTVWLRGVASGDHPARLSLIDVSEEHNSARQQRYLQSQLTHLARRNMAGEFAASLAHELNQPLGTVVLSCDAALRFLSEGGADREEFSGALSQAREAALYASSVIGQLREFLKDGERDAQAARRTVPLEQVVDTVLALIDANARDNDVALSLDIADTLPPVHVNLIQIGQVLVNLTHNSIEAMAGLDEARLSIRARPDRQGRVLVSVEDTGPGVSADILDRLFNPFQTNKAGGMGMGLAISQNIIEAHGGELWAERPPSGALFCFTLPAAARGDHEH